MPLSTVYPPQGFFSPLPRAVWGMAQAGQLTGRDVQVLGLLLDYKNARTPIVGPGQRSLARRLACSVDTIQRALSRLVAAGLVAILPQRSTDGRRRGNHYDLSPTLALLPPKAAKMRSGQWGAPPAPPAGEGDGKRPNLPTSTMPQKCGPEAYSCDVEADNTATAPGNAAPASPVVAQLVGVGVFRRVAESLVTRYGSSRVADTLTASALGNRRTNRAGWIVAALLHGWKLSAPAPPPRPRAANNSLPPPPPLGAGAPGGNWPDVLATLDAAALADLERRARAQLIDETRPPLRDHLRRGRDVSRVKARMRELLSRENDHVPRA